MFSQRVMANLYIAIGPYLQIKSGRFNRARNHFGVAAVIAMLAIGNGAQQNSCADKTGRCK